MAKLGMESNWRKSFDQMFCSHLLKVMIVQVAISEVPYPT